MPLMSPEIHRRSNGTIDIDYYRDRAHSLRRQAGCDLMRGSGGMAWIAAVMTVVLLAIIFLAPRRHVDLAQKRAPLTALAREVR